MARDLRLEERIKRDMIHYFTGRRSKVSRVHEGLKRLLGQSRIKRLDINISYDTWARYSRQAHLVNHSYHSDYIQHQVVKKLSTLHKIINHSGKIVWFVVNHQESWAVMPLSYDQWEEHDTQLMISNVMEN